MTIRQFINICKTEDWQVNYDSESKGMELYKFSPAGEDFSIYIQGGNANEFITELKTYYEDFDVDQHAIDWYGAGRGEPSSLRELLDDAEAIKEMIYSLYQKLENNI